MSERRPRRRFSSGGYRIRCTRSRRLPRAVFLMQKEVAERLTAAHGSRDYGFLTVQTAVFARAY